MEANMHEVTLGTGRSMYVCMKLLCFCEGLLTNCTIPGMLSHSGIKMQPIKDSFMCYMQDFTSVLLKTSSNQESICVF
jgi:hypothetical protein